MSQKEFTGVWIPKHILEDKDLSWTEIILYAEIQSFLICFKSNESLAKRLRLSKKQSVSPMLKKLKEKGYILEIGFDGRNKSWKAILDQPSQKDDSRVNKIINSELTKSLTIDNNIDNNEIEHSEDKPQTEIFSFKETLNKLSVSKRKIDLVIYHYLTFREINYTSKEAFKKAFPRLCAEAKQLEGYNSEQIEEIFSYCQKEGREKKYDWNLSTAVKKAPLIIK